jgi:ABC-type sugar transport system substrate-binding protein
MPHDVFVSYSSKDKAVADGIVASLERNNIRCWYAPRDIKPSDDWGEAIANAIGNSKLFLLVFSGNANQSRHVLDELIVAIDEEITMLPFRIENLEPKGAMRLHLSSWHWLDAYAPSWEAHIMNLIKNISGILDTSLNDENIKVPEAIGRVTNGKKQKKTLSIVVGIAIVALLLAAGWFGYKALIPPSQKIDIAADTSNEGLMTAATEDTEEYTYADMVLCYPAFGADHIFQKTSTASVIQSAKEKGIKQLVISDAQKDQENQLSAIHSCIQQGVNVIVIPVFEDYGWTDVLAEAQEAGIPVIIIKEESIYGDDSLYDVHLLIDNFLQGQKSAEEMNKLLPEGGNIVELSGPDGVEQAKKRSSGFRDVLNNNISILDSKTGNWNREDAVPVVEDFLNNFKGQIDGMYIQNDDMAMGAIEALKAAGVGPGEIKIVSIDGTKEAFQAMIDGWIHAEVETNPMFGSQLIEIALDLMNGKNIEREISINQIVYYPDEAEDLLTTRVW